MTDKTITIDGQPVPLDDVIWLGRRPCGCVVSGVVAVVADEWELATADDANRHFHHTDGERRRATAAGLTFEPVTGLRYRTEFAGRWHCTVHARPAAG
ncbi:hypothetical protein ABZ400_01970 [Streptomyces sp. NPDC005897]|uniref:hypothetical protein n=1 Tax=Streptomyces sp. NPDC005897 TaxID=3157081 RepID=UPI0033C294B9